ncbi:hypothetical protein WA026_019796 [Henosepilachna vigintioctopunctata]|uniref:Uncharacterized protein n=1 Tax=Henosepilachna vigintioctopunctata TaxID=420089 RepID=A0AAW1VGX2_9CUCU
MEKKSCNEVTSSVLGFGAGSSREYSYRGTRQVSQVCEEHTATDGKTTAKDLDKSKKNMNEIQNSKQRRKTECGDLNKTMTEVENITREDSFLADINTDNKTKRKRLSSSPQEGVEKYRKTGMDISTEKIIEQFEKLEKFCEQNKNVHKPIKESVGMMRFAINRLRKGMENEESCKKNEELQRKNITQRKKERELEISMCQETRELEAKFEEMEIRNQELEKEVEEIEERKDACTQTENEKGIMDHIRTEEIRDRKSKIKEQEENILDLVNKEWIESCYNSRISTKSILDMTREWMLPYLWMWKMRRRID